MIMLIMSNIHSLFDSCTSIILGNLSFHRWVSVDHKADTAFLELLHHSLGDILDLMYTPVVPHWVTIFATALFSLMDDVVFELELVGDEWVVAEIWWKSICLIDKDFEIEIV
jgi:hypothetical protein